jgi:hypothetical protein
MLEQAVIDLTAEIMLLRETLQQTSTPKPSAAPKTQQPEQQQAVWLTPAKFAKLVDLKPTSVAAKRKNGQFRDSSFKFEKRGHLGIYLYHRVEAAKDLGKL